MPTNTKTLTSTKALTSTGTTEKFAESIAENEASPPSAATSDPCTSGYADRSAVEGESLAARSDGASPASMPTRIATAGLAAITRTGITTG